MEKCDLLLGVREDKTNGLRFTVRNYIGWRLGKQGQCSPALRAGVTCSLLWINGIYSLTQPKKGCSHPAEAQHPPQNTDFKSACLTTTAASPSAVYHPQASRESSTYLFLPEHHLTLQFESAGTHHCKKKKIISHSCPWNRAQLESYSN